MNMLCYRHEAERFSILMGQHFSCGAYLTGHRTPLI